MSMGHSKSSSSAAATLKRSRSPSLDCTVAPSSTHTDAAVKSILNSRKCWRSLKGKEEPVWPPHLEAALIEGLEKYKPSESKSTRVLSRFPMRNKFVADHIFDTTGVRRTPKQVGSRIQQLRDTQSGKQILKVISDRHYEMMHPIRASSSRTASTGTCTLQSPSMMPTFSPSHIWVQTLPASAAWRFGSYPPSTGDLHSSMPRPLRLINPTVTFSSLSQTPCQSIFTVYRESQLIHQEVAPVTITASTSGSSGASPCWMYSTTLVPKFWSHLCDSEEPMSYSIHQEVMRIPMSAHAPQPPMLAVYYHFVNGALTPPLSPRSSSGDSETSSLSRESSPNYAARVDDVDAKPYPGSGRTLDGYAPAASPLVYSYDSSSPGSPLVDLHAVGVEGWGYTASGGIQEMLSSCDPIFDPYISL